MKADHSSTPRNWGEAWSGLRALRLGFVAIVIGFVPALLLLAPAWGHVMPGVPQGIPAFLGTSLLAGAFARTMWNWKCPRCAHSFGGWIGNPWPDRCAYCGIVAFSALEEVRREYDVQPVRGGALLNRRLRLSVAAVEVISGTFIIGLSAWIVAKGAPFGGWLMLFFQSIGILAITAGVLLWRDKIVGYELSGILQLLQIVRFHAPAFSFVLATGPELLLFWTAKGPSWYAGLDATLTLGRPAPRVAYIGVNLAAVVLFHLIRKGRLHAQALERVPQTASAPAIPVPADDLVSSA